MPLSEYTGLPVVPLMKMFWILKPVHLKDSLESQVKLLLAREGFKL